MDKLKVLVGVVIAGCVLAAGVIFWPKIQERFVGSSIDKELLAKNLQKAEEHLQQGHPEQALLFLNPAQINFHTDLGRKELELLIQANTELHNIPSLLLLYERYPQAFEKDEKAALLVEDGYISSNKPKDYQILRDKWSGKETNSAAWFVLDADKLLIEGKQNEARTMLKSKEFTGKDDVNRLVRLALINVVDNPKLAWEYLTEAYKKDPTNPEIHTYRAKLLEAVGKKSLALSEFISAVQTDPENPFLRDQLAEFYLRNNQHHEALLVWFDSLKPPSLDFLWVKAFFWNRVITPVKFDWSSIPIPEGKMKPFIEYLIHLPQGVFWNEKAFDKLDDAQTFVKNLQSVYWLRILSFLEDKADEKAWDLLQYDPFNGISWSPEIEQALKRVLIYRKSGAFSINKYPPPLETFEGKKAENPFFEQLEQLAKNSSAQEIPQDVKDLLLSEEAFAAVFLAGGWYEAALELHKMSVVPSGFPDWVAYNLTKAIRNNRGDLQALQFANRQKQTPALSLLISEMYLSTGSPDAALEKLNQLVNEPGDIGFNASRLISIIYLEKKDYQAAQKSVESQPKLAESTVGKEILARVALKEGNVELANNIYTSIEKESAEAKSYLARVAFNQKEYARARQLTEQLIRDYPDNLMLRENLKKIISEENSSTR